MVLGVVSRTESTGDRAFCSRAAPLTVTFNANARLADSRPWRSLLSCPFRHSVHMGVQVMSSFFVVLRCVNSAEREEIGWKFGCARSREGKFRSALRRAGNFALN